MVACFNLTITVIDGFSHKSLFLVVKLHSTHMSCCKIFFLNELAKEMHAMLMKKKIDLSWVAQIQQKAERTIKLLTRRHNLPINNQI